MKAKEYLQQVRKLDMLIQNKLMEKEQWKAMAMSTGFAPEGERVQSSGSKQKMADAVCRYADMDAEIDRFIDHLIDIKMEVIRTIEQLPTIEYDLLHKMYIGIVDGNDIKYMELDEVAACYKKSYSWATTVHGRALKNVNDILKGVKT